MPVNATWGELLVGAYHKRMNGCEVVSYNNRSEERGNQMEADVIAIDNDRGKGRQNVYVCEVVTHMSGKLYSGTPDDGWWTEFTNTKAHQFSLQKLQKKFLEDYRYVKYVWQRQRSRIPVLGTCGYRLGRGSGLIEGLEELADRFESETGEELELIINQDYTERIENLQTEAQGDTSDYGAPAFRFLQILENLK